MSTPSINPNNVPSKKYIFLTIYLVVITDSLISTFHDEKTKDKE